MTSVPSSDSPASPAGVQPRAMPRGAMPRAALWAGGAVGAAVATGATAYLVTHDPHVAGSYPRCVLLSVTGLWCPACGVTRAAYDLLHGDVAGAFARNPVVPLLAMLTIALVVRAVWRRRTAGRTRRPLPVWVPVGIGVAVLVFGVLRNVPGWTWLSPM